MTSRNDFAQWGVRPISLFYNVAEFSPPASAPTFCAGFLQLGALGSETHFGEPQEDEAQDECRVFLRLETGVGAELVRGIPEAFFERGVLGVFFRWDDPDHEADWHAISNCFTSNQIAGAGKRRTRRKPGPD